MKYISHIKYNYIGLLLLYILLSPLASHAQEAAPQPVPCELSFGVQYSSSYSSCGNGLDLPKSPFRDFRSSGNFSLALTKWVVPSIGLRTKGNWYWGRHVISDNAQTNKVKQFSVSEQVLWNISRTRVKTIIPPYNFMLYGGVGYTRHCTINDNSITLSIGMLQTYRISPLAKIYLDFGYMVGGERHNHHFGHAVTSIGTYKWLTADIGLSIELSRRRQ